VGINMIPGFQNTGTWYDYFTGEVIQVNDLNNAFFLEPGEYRLYTSVPLETPVIDVNVEEVNVEANFKLFPNPSNDQSTIVLDDSWLSGQDVSINILDLSGKNLSKVIDIVSVGMNNYQLNGLDQLPSGVYVIEIANDKQISSQTLLVQAD
ncbi:MAG: T9SS type A sorting domain-containing protein, partial [Bacteroidetes bacterium]|nr:T9SS type A sorting domain-containing protein [Bacteroidota bacterium]